LSDLIIALLITFSLFILGYFSVPLLDNIAIHARRWTLARSLDNFLVTETFVQDFALARDPALGSLRAIEEKNVEWVDFMDTKEEHEKLKAILADPSGSISEESTTTRLSPVHLWGFKTWQKKMTDVQFRRDAIYAEQKELWTKREKLRQECKTTTSAEIKQLISEKCDEIMHKVGRPNSPCIIRPLSFPPQAF
jgi:hypothetical protein